MGIKSSLPNTFKGDRGGSAEDADLLAELRAISKNSSSNRFADTDDVKDGMNVVESQHGNVQAKDSAVAPPQPKPILQNTQPAHDIGGPTMPSMNPFPTESGSAPEITITLDGLGESLASTNWQIRKASYLFLQEKILHSLAGREPENQLSGDDVYSALDATIMKALSDKNAGALDCALALSVTYSDCCRGACLEDNASQIMSLLLKGAAFASSRPSTLKTTQELVFKLIEVAPEGSSTADNVIELIQQHGLKAKKPKVVQFAAKLVLQMVQEFGTVIFSVPKLSAVHETLVSNSNDKIRAIGIEVLAELCRTFGSKTPMQALIEKLKKSQQSQLDTLLDEQPSPTPPTRQLRCKRGVQITTLSPEEALAALKKSEEEEKLKRFATRPAVNLLQVLPRTCYKAKINEAKWSEKVEALNALIEAGGEQPFKICPPSGSINYTPLLRELKQLLSHTHYLVCSKALAAIGMLAEGVGEPLSSNLGPLLSAIVPLFKDKKVGKAVMSCLEKMFGNALSFDHFLDSNDSFLLSLDEKKEKNALVRKSVLEFLARCIEASGSYGTCGKLSKQHAEELCKIACQKLKDSDATTRKAATDVLVALLSSTDDAVVSAANEITSSLQSTNPRAYKTLHLATKSGQPSDSKRGASRPGTAPLKSTSQQSSNPGVGKARPTSAPKSDRAANVKSDPVKVSATGTVDEKSDESLLPSLEESIAHLSQIGIPQWGDDADNGGVLAGIQCKFMNRDQHDTYSLCVAFVN
jgi:cytoskeleton-associated protein 5